MDISLQYVNFYVMKFFLLYPLIIHLFHIQLPMFVGDYFISYIMRFCNGGMQ